MRLRAVGLYRDQKFTDGFDEVFRSAGVEIVRTPFHAPQLNGDDGTVVRTVRSECLDWLFILNAKDLERALHVFPDHYNGHRPHRALDLSPPDPIGRAVIEWNDGGVQRRDRLGGGVIHEYRLAV
jgi:hypothetical protein